MRIQMPPGYRLHRHRGCGWESWTWSVTRPCGAVDMSGPNGSPTDAQRTAWDDYEGGGAS